MKVQPRKDVGGCDVKNLPPEKPSHCKHFFDIGRMLLMKANNFESEEILPAADVGGGGEEGEADMQKA